METKASYTLIGFFTLAVMVGIFGFVYWFQNLGGTFAALVQSAGYPNILLSPDAETLDHGAAMGCAGACAGMVSAGSGVRWLYCHPK